MPTDYDVHQTDALIIGAGAGGLRAAIAMAERGVRPLVLGKRDHGDAHTIWAAGGINASLGSLDPEDDDWTIHAADTLKEGHFINDVRAVELMCHNIPARILELQEWGCEFDRPTRARSTSATSAPSPSGAPASWAIAPARRCWRRSSTRPSSSTFPTATTST